MHILNLKSLNPQSRLWMRVIQLHVLSGFGIKRIICPRKSPAQPRSEQPTDGRRRNTTCSRGSFSSPTPSLILLTDTSKTGWGAHWGDVCLAGSWSPEIAKYQINLLELWTIHLALSYLHTRVKGQVVTVHRPISGILHKQARGTPAPGPCAPRL